MAEERELSKDLGLLAALTIGVGTMIGAGIFVLPGEAAAAAGPAAALAFVVAGFIALFTALSISELGTAMPKAGGGYYYINDALGPLFGSIAGWGNWLGLAFATAFYMIGFGTYAAIFLPIPELLFLNPSQVGALVAGLIFIGVNYYGTKETGSIQVVIVIILVFVLLVFTAVGLFHVDTANLQPFAPAETGGWGAVLPAAGLIFVTYLGFAEINTVAEELKNPGRNLPLAVIGSLLFVIAFYALVMLVVMGVAPYEVVAGHGEEAVPRIAESLMGWTGLALLTFGGLLATASSANASVLASSRINFAMGRDRIITDWINEVHPKFTTPYRSIAITGVLILVFILIGDIEVLAKAGSVLHLIVYGLLNVALIVYRETDAPGYDPDFTVPLYPIVPILGAFLSFALIGFMAPIEILLSVGFVVFGAVWYVLYAKDNADPTGLLGEAIAPEDDDDEDDDVYRVVVPLSNPETEQPLVRYAAASASGRDSGAELVVVNVIEVPQQTAPSQLDLEEERVQRQQELLESARDTAEQLDVNLRTRAIVGRNAGDAVLSIIDDEDADHVLLGWAGPRRRRDVLFGSTIDPILEQAPCEVTLVKDPTEQPGDIVTLAGRGPTAPVSARRAAELSRTFPDTSLTLLNVQPRPDPDDAEDERSDEEERIDPQRAGEAAIEQVASAAELSPDEYETSVLVADDVRRELITAVATYDTVCVGTTGESMVARALYGTVPSDIVENVDGTVVMARGPDRTPRTVRQGILERLGLTTDR